MDHADTGGHGCPWMPEDDWSPIKGDGAGIGHQKSVEDPHEGRFAGPVLPDYGMDLTAIDGERDILIGPQGSEAFADMVKFEKRTGFGSAGKGLDRPVVPHRAVRAAGAKFVNSR